MKDIDEIFSETVHKDIPKWSKMPLDEYNSKKLYILAHAALNSSCRAYRFLEAAFFVADKKRPLLLEMKGKK